MSARLSTVETASPRALDLGSGPCPAAGYVGVDVQPAESSDPEARSPKPDPLRSPTVIYADLFDGTPWPFPDGSVERLRAWHVIEHIPHERIVIGQRRIKRIERRRGSGNIVIATHHESVPETQDAFFWFFDEAFRVAKPGCRFELGWPHPQSDGADQDPTHCRRIPTSMLHYLSVEGRRMLRVHHYPVVCNWTIEPGSVQELGSAESLAPFTLPDGSLDVARARRAHGVFHEIRATLIKP